MALVGGFSNFQLIMGAVTLIGLGSLSLIVAGVYRRLQTSDKDIFEAEDIQNLVKPEIMKMVSYWGSDASMKLRYRYDSKGTVYKVLDYRAKINDTVSENSDKKKVNVEIDEGALERDYDQGKISERIYKLIKKFDQEKVLIMLVRPSGFMAKVSYSIEKLLGSSDMTDRMIIVPKRLVQDDVDFLTIKDKAQFTRFAGMDVAVEASAFNFIQSIGFRNLYAQALQDQQNYHKQVNFYSSRFSQELQKLEKKGDLDGGDYDGKKVEIINEK